MYSARRRPQAATLVFRRGVSRSAFPLREKCHGAPAVWLGAKGTYLICPILRRRYLAPLSLSMSETRLKSQTAERGTLPGLSHTLNERTARMSFDRKRSRMSSSMP